MLAASRGKDVVNGSLRYLLETALVVGAALVVVVAGTAGGRDAALPAVGLVLAAAFRLLPALNRVLFLVNQVQYNGPALDFVGREVETYCVADPDALPEDTSPITPIQLEREMRVEDVTFRYPNRTQPALRKVGFSVLRGESVGIVGPDRLGQEHPS